MSATPAPQPGQDDEGGTLEQVVEDVAEGTREAAAFVARVGSAFSQGYTDGRARS